MDQKLKEAVEAIFDAVTDLKGERQAFGLTNDISDWSHDIKIRHLEAIIDALGGSEPALLKETFTKGWEAALVWYWHGKQNLDESFKSYLEKSHD